MLEIKNSKINVLGTEYTIFFKDLKDDEYASKNNFAGYCDEIMKEIVIINYNTLEGCENDTKERCNNAEKYTLRHEIYHAFLNESGLSNCSLQLSGAWAKNEEMIDWLAIQSPKIYAVFEELELL